MPEHIRSVSAVDRKKNGHPARTRPDEQPGVAPASLSSFQSVGLMAVRPRV